MARASGIRRRSVTLATLAIGSAGLGAVCIRAALATPDNARSLLKTLANGEPREGRIIVKVPEIAENGQAVPLTVVVESPMTAQDHVKAMHIVADGNPSPGVASFYFSPSSGRCEVQLRIRLAQTQKVIVLAEMSDGSLWTAAHEVKVTVGGC